MRIIGTQGQIFIDTQTQMVQIATGDHIWTSGTLDCDEIGGHPGPCDRHEPSVSGQSDGVPNSAMLVALHESGRKGRPFSVAELAGSPTGATA